MIHTAAIDESVRPLIFTLPKAECMMVDNWDVMGLRAISADDYTVEAVFVPDAYVYEVTTTTPVHGGAIYEVGLANMSGIQYGVGARDGKALARGDAKAGQGEVTARWRRDDDGPVLRGVWAGGGQTPGCAGAFLMPTWADNEETIDRGESLSTH